MDNTYNGFTNKETYLFNIWHGDQVYVELYDYFSDDLDDFRDAIEDGTLYGRIHTILNGYIDNILELEDFPGIGLLNDLVSHSMARIDLHDLTDSLMDSLTTDLLD